MKTVILYIALVLFTPLFASDTHWESVLLKKILFSMTQKKELVVYCNDAHLNTVLDQIRGVKVVHECYKADFVLYKGHLKSPCSKPEIVFDYASYLKNENAVGVFFWQKGRPTIRFSKKRLRKFQLKVRGELVKFVSST